uniref:Morc S5 domain-containing protein n=1 Tax=Aegilops tauschii subsp. strangulata TaxID=200361 RepID=A0A452ZUT2_AEGTS
MDSKTICRTKVCDVPNTIKVPSVWSISSKFMPTREYRQSDFLKFSLLPDPEDGNQAKEWERFTGYLRESGKASIVKFSSGTLHILAPKPHSSSHVVILYETGIKEPGVCKNMAGISGISNESGEICDNTSHPMEIISSPKHHNQHGILNPAVTKGASIVIRNFVSTNPNYLRTLSQAHAGWIFGAIAELIDNSRDAGASRLDISIQSMFSKQAGQKVPVLCVVDNGHGMTYAQMMRMVSFGHKGPNEHCQDQIGRFGIGFKTGAMKLGRDAFVLTQTSTSRSVSFLSQSFNENKDNLEIPVVTYCKKDQYMEVDLGVQSEATAEYNLNAIKKFSPFNEYFIGEKVGLFGEEGTGTQVYIWNLDRWGTDYTLEWNSQKTDESPDSHGNGDILIRSKRVRSRPGQTNGNVPLDYSLKAYVEVMFLNPQMKITVQGSPVNTHMPYILLCCDILYSCCLCFFLFPMLALVPYDATPTSTFRRGGTRTQPGCLTRSNWPMLLANTHLLRNQAGTQAG